MTDVVPFLRPQLRAAGLEAKLDHLYFSAREGRALAQDELVAAIARERYTLIGLSFLTYEGIPPYPALLAEADRLSGDELTRRVDQIDAAVREYIGAVREATNATIVLHGASGLPLTKLREFVPVLAPPSRGRRRAVALFDSRLRELAANTENVIFLDEAGAVSAGGLRAASRRLMSRAFTHGGVFHPSAFGPLETVLLRGPIDAETGFATAVGHYVPTERNRPCAALFSEKGFSEAAPGEWRLDLGGALPEIPDWLALTRL